MILRSFIRSLHEAYRRNAHVTLTGVSQELFFHWETGAWTFQRETCEQLPVRKSRNIYGVKWNLLIRTNSRVEYRHARLNKWVTLRPSGVQANWKRLGPWPKAIRWSWRWARLFTGHTAGNDAYLFYLWRRIEPGVEMKLLRKKETPVRLIFHGRK